MPTQVLMPALSPTMEEGKLAKWVKAEGDEVRSGDVIAEIETDKATMEVEAVDEGKLGKILVPAGTEGVKVNTPIAVILTDGEDTSTLANGVASMPNGGAEPSISDSGTSEVHATVDVKVRDTAPDRLPVGYDSAVEIPAGAEMVQITMREALRDAMAEEMRRDDNVFVMGEEVAEYQGAYKVTQGLLDEFGPRRVVDTPITEAGFAGTRRRRGLRRTQAYRRIHDLQLRDAGHRPHHQLGGQDALHVRRPDGVPHRIPWAERRCGPRWRAAQPGVLRVVCPCARPQGGCAIDIRRREGAFEGCDTRSEPGRVS